MFPDWVIRSLQEMGVPGAIIFVLLLTVIALATIIKRMQTKADKIYGYRLAERDTLNKALTDTAKVMADLLDVSRDRNDLTQQQADLIQKQTTAFELLKVTVLGQYENIKENNHAVSQAVTAMADSVRTLTAMLLENRHISTSFVNDVKTMIAASGNEVKDAVRAASQAQIADVRNQLGSDLTIIQRRRASSHKRKSSS